MWNTNTSLRDLEEPSIGAPVDPPAWSVAGRIIALIIIGLVLATPIAFTVSSHLDVRAFDGDDRDLARRRPDLAYRDRSDMMLMEIGPAKRSLRQAAGEHPALWLWACAAGAGVISLLWERAALGRAWRQRRTLLRGESIARAAIVGVPSLAALVATFSITNGPDWKLAMGGLLAASAAAALVVMTVLEATAHAARGWVSADALTENGARGR